MEIDLDGLPGIERYRFLVSAVVPRPIAFVSTLSAGGSTNVAPFSYFNVVTARPPLVSVAIGQRKWEGEVIKKDTLTNIEQTGEFVINLATTALLDAINESSAEYAPGESEIEALGLTPAPSSKVQPPRIAESPVHLECRLERLVMLGDEPQQGLVIGRVVHVHVEDAVLDPETKTVNPTRLSPLARLGGNYYATLGDLIERVRPTRPK
jgi:flavin reductase (DIM6/NTAB) family NADH-FMN oxidoreductase RutF